MLIIVPPSKNQTSACAISLQVAADDIFRVADHPPKIGRARPTVFAAGWGTTPPSPPDFLNPSTE